MKDLLEPMTFRGGVRVRNRVALAAMTNLQSHVDGSLSDDELRWLEMRAAGGFGVVTTCASHVALDGQGWAGELGIYDASLLPGLRRLATTLRQHGAISMVQIFHGGLRADSTLTNERPWSASENPKASEEEKDKGSREGTEEDIHRVIGQFADAAGRARDAGFDGVEIHGAHGYLLTQFLSTIDNRRTDAWGGSIENRARLIREVTRAVRARVPAPFVVGVRLSPEDFGQARGIDLDESLQVARWLCDDGADFLHLSLWRSQNNTAKRPDQHALTAFREVIPDEVRLLVAGNLWTREDADRMLSLGADMIALGRSAIANPAWADEVADASWAPKRPPLTSTELLERGLSAGFVEYMRRWKGFVTP